MFEQMRLENDPDVVAFGVAAPNDDNSTSKLESTYSEFERLSREVAAAKRKRDLAKREASNEKKKAEDVRQKLAGLLDCKHHGKVRCYLI